MTASAASGQALPSALATLLAATNGRHEAEWEGRSVVLINQAWGSLILSLQGAQLLHFAPHGQAPWLWTSSVPKPVPAAIRGGIPLCWPWFADREDGQGPAHGYARTANWRLDACEEEAEGVELHLSPVEALDPQLSPRVVIQANAQRLRIELITEHRGDTPVKFTQALHSYFAVANAHTCRVEGLAGATYLDKLRGMREFEQAGELAIRGELDRIYHSNRSLVLVDPRTNGERRLSIAKEGSDSSVIWHPGDKPPGDVAEAELLEFLCVEAACTRLDPIWLAPGGQHLLAQQITLL
ncbi:D-hexose-6-phosphate mutarotase [Halotalea alkalilenta]|uniref:Putative glucose-6-phosphate 1-epimerase n=1 Tax=Halotalea alkalilenta TaxID=376489 RepID=A0A172YCS9_9GAMM|nr:D-hexose-6-phosphate mutarotase [Halotalea alkalilenta]ANF57060.1 D-hexose-6-phosphate mutarotase [Halotalea alkalilenta]